MRREPADARGLIIEPRAVWLLAGVISVGVVLFVLVTHALDTLLLFFVAIVFGEGIRPVVDWLEQRHMPRPAAVLGIYVVLAAVVFGLFALLLRPLTTQLAALLTNLPSYIQRIQTAFQNLQQLTGGSPEAQQALEAIPSQITGMSANLATQVLTAPLLAAEFVFKFIELYLMAFFWLTATQSLKPFAVSLFPPDLRLEASQVISELGRRMGGYLRATAINMFVIAALSGAGMALLGVAYPILLALVAGLAESLPLVGPWVAGALAVTVTLFTGGVLPAGEVAGLYLLIHLIEGNTLVPYVTYRLTRLNPLITILAIAVGGSVLGVVGAVLGVPIALALQVLTLRVLVPGLRHLAGVATRSELEHPGVR